eukprot:6172512-Pleurochrysis_carterae.AAC.3
MSVVASEIVCACCKLCEAWGLAAAASDPFTLNEHEAFCTSKTAASSEAELRERPQHIASRSCNDQERTGRLLLCLCVSDAVDRRAPRLAIRAPDASAFCPDWKFRHNQLRWREAQKGDPSYRRIEGCSRT